MTSLLVSSVGRRVTVVKSLLAEKGPDDLLYVADSNPTAAALHVSGIHRSLTPGSTDELLAEIPRLQVDAILSLHDYEVLRIAAHAERLADQGVKFLGPSASVAQSFIDKLTMARHLQCLKPELAVPTKTAHEWLRDGDYPCIVKAREGSASAGFGVVQSPRELLERISSSQVELVAQPLIQGTEYNVDVFLDLGEVRGVCVKQKLAMRGGETDAAIVLPSPPVAVEASAERAVRGLDISGNVDIDLILSQEGRVSVIDVNPRFGGGYSFSAAAGYGAAKGVWQLAAGKPVDPFLRPTRSMVGAKYPAVMEVAWPMPPS